MRDITIGCESEIPEPVEARLKEDAIKYFRTRFELYAERYSVPAQGDVLWDRHDAIVQIVAECNLAKGSKIIDLGCGPGFLSFDLAKQGYRGIGLDASPAMIQHCRLQSADDGAFGLWSYMLGDVEAVPLQEGVVDAAICAGVIEYLPNDVKLLHEVRRVLKPGGHFILCVTNKFGYTTSLSSLLYWCKRIPGAIKAASMLRTALVGGRHGAMQFTFRPRKHRPSVIRQMLSKAGFQVKTDRYVQFSLLPSPLCTLTSKLKLKKLTDLDRTPLRVFGSCYILSAVKEG